MAQQQTLDQQPAATREELFGHPKGLFVLFLTEMWERFSYYGMRAILTLYMYTSVMGDNPGLGWDEGFAISIYGLYTGLVYIMSIPGGLLADRLLGQKRAVMLGGFLLCVGQSILAVHGLSAFWTGLCLNICGVGLLKPNISTIVGGLYRKGDIRRDKGFTIFYMGINCGALLAAIIAGGIGEKYGWHYGFGLAGIGMIIGQVTFLLGQKHLRGIGESAKKLQASGVDLKRPLTKIEKDRMAVLLLSFIIIIVFWGAFEQAGGLMNIYTNEKVNRYIMGWEMPTTWFQGWNPAFIILLGTAVAGFWAKRQLKGKESSTLLKMAVGTIIMGTGFLMMTGAAMESQVAADGKAALYWVVGAYLLHTIGELCASPTALSFITKLAPVKYASFMMGAYFAATGCGNILAGYLGHRAQSAGELQIFVGIFIFTAVFGILLRLFLKKLKALTHGAEDVEG